MNKKNKQLDDKANEVCGSRLAKKRKSMWLRTHENSSSKLIIKKKKKKKKGIV